jgi:Fibronectin type III domain
MKKYFKKIILFILFLRLGGLGGFAQLYPVQMTTVFNSPYSSKVSDYATSMDVKMQLLINPTDVSITNRQVKLKLYLQGNGIQAQTSDFVLGETPIFINGGELLTLTNLDLAPLFRLENLQGLSPNQYANTLPEGVYAFCFEMFDYATNQRISQKSCANIYLLLNDPPQLNTPTRNEQITATDFPNILFTWTPRQANAINVTYKLELKQIIDPNLDPQFAFAVSPLIYEETLFAPTLIYNTSKPALQAGMRYAWRVRAISTSGLSENAVFKNDGYSEIFWFTYASTCNAPTFVLSEVRSPKSVKITWQGSIDNTKYHVQYKKTNSPPLEGSGGGFNEWFSIYTLNTQTTLNDLEPGVSYDFRVGGSCEPANTPEGSFTYSGINTFTTATQTTAPNFNCGIKPDIKIENQKPLPSLLPSESFTAGDFPVKVLQVSGSNGNYSGKGYIIVPYLADTKIAVEFNDVTINTAYQLIEGVVETTYDATWSNVVATDPLIEEIFGPQTGTETIDTPDPETTTDGTGGTGTVGTGTTETNTPGTGTTNTNTTTTDTTTTGGTATSTNTNTTTTENTTSNPNPSSTGTNVTGNDYYIEYKGKKYYTGGKIKIPYKRSMLETFEMKTVPTDAKVNFTIHEPGKQEMWRGYTGNSSRTSIPIEENNPSLVNLRILDLQSKAFSISGEPKVVVEVEKVVKPFVFSKLEAIDLSNKSRVANAGETLYYINKPTVSKESKNTSFKITTNPNLTINEIPVENIKWKFNDTSDENKNGVKDFSVYVYENKDAKVTGITGFPNSSSKNVNVKWVDEDKQKYQVVAPGLQNTIEIIFSNIEKFKKVVDDLGVSGWELKPVVKFSGTQYNKEDPSSRFYDITREGTVDCGVDLKFEVPLPPPFSYKLKIPILNYDIGEVGAYIDIKGGIWINGSIKYKKRNDQSKFKLTESKVGLKASGGLEFGLKAKILPDVKDIKFDIKAYGKANLVGLGQAVFDENGNYIDFEPKVYFEPLIGGYSGKIEAGGYVIFNQSFEWTLLDRFDIYPKK